MNEQYADSLIEEGHKLWKAGRISEAFALQNMALSIKKRIERESDYTIILTSEGMRIRQERDRDTQMKLYQEAYDKYKTECADA